MQRYKHTKNMHLHNISCSILVITYFLQVKNIEKRNCMTDLAAQGAKTYMTSIQMRMDKELSLIMTITVHVLLLQTLLDSDLFT